MEDSTPHVKPDSLLHIAPKSRQIELMKPATVW